MCSVLTLMLCGGCCCGGDVVEGSVGGHVAV